MQKNMYAQSASVQTIQKVETMPTKPLAEIPSAAEIHEALIVALHEARDAIPAARQARRSRVEIAQAIDHRISVVRLARSHNMPLTEIAEHLGVSVSYVQKMGSGAVAK
jgi:DNA-directed RNA polymerase specialized sigma subunit